METDEKKTGQVYGTLAFADFSEEDYAADSWPLLRDAVVELLTIPQGKLVPMSYEKVYSCVYRCVCRQFPKQLHSDLLQLVTLHLQDVGKQLQNNTSCKVLTKFCEILHQYTYALSGILPIFTYLNKYYIQLKLNSDLETELKNLFRILICERYIQELISALTDVALHPFTVPPAVAAEVVGTLHSLKPDFAQLHPCLFAKYLPNVLEASSLQNLDLYITEVRQQQAQLLHHPDFGHNDQSRKRPHEDDM